MTDEAAHPYNRSRRIIVPYVFICIFLNNRWEDKIFCAMPMTYICKGVNFWITDVV
jgi:hypothetical protein